MNAEFDNHLNESQLNSDESSDFNVASLEYNESSEHSVEKDNIINDENTRKMNIKMLIIVKTMICLKEINLVKFKIQIIKMIINMILMSLFLKRVIPKLLQQRIIKIDDANHKAPIRRGPNIKLPSLDLLEDHEEHEIDESWIEEKQELNDAFIILMYLLKFKMLQKDQV